jgi:ATP-dependent Lon protease
METRLSVPLLPLAGSVLFPRSIYPLALQGEQAQFLVKAALDADEQVAVFMQLNPTGQTTTPDDLRTVGTLVRLTNVQNGPEGTLDVEAEGVGRVVLSGVEQWEPYVKAEVMHLPEPEEEGAELDALAEQLKSLYRALVATDPSAEKLLPALETTDRLSDLAYLVAATIPVSPETRQAVLQAESNQSRLRGLIEMLETLHRSRTQTASADRPVPGSPQLAHGGSAARDDALTLLRARLAAASLPEEAAQIAERELARLAALSPASPDSQIIRTYLDWLADLPWRSEVEPSIDLARAREILDQEHYGLDDVKERILEYLAVRKLRHDRAHSCGLGAAEPAGVPREPVLCLVGPPGIGKTSLGRSIAEAVGRPFVHLSLGGVGDEADIRGHRRTYLGAMPGRIVQSLARLGANYPLIMLDEIDKLGSNGKGDPASALLEVLDPEQQRAFVDHYIDLPLDLSSVFFVATANVTDSLPPALRDRLEVIQLSGYTEEEKVQIARRHILPHQMESHALNDGDVVWEPDALTAIVRGYTREAGVRQLERQIAALCRRVASLVARSKRRRRPYIVDEAFVSAVLGSPRYAADQPEVVGQPGIVTGVVWTPVGGEIIHVEASLMPGNKTLTITGQLGEVMRESAQAALSYVRSRAEEISIDPRFFDTHDLHIHVPSGAVPKDGPSAGVTLAVALVSLLTGRAVSTDVAMTGEITLRGRVLPVGGIKEKLLAARRGGITRVIIPALNSRDLEGLPPEALDGLEILTVETMEEVLDAALPAETAARKP